MSKKTVVETKYQEPSLETVKAIENLFENASRFNLTTCLGGYFIEVTSMYDYVSFVEGMSILMGYMKIAQLLGVKDGDEVGRDHSHGCPTCDYGSSYSVTLKFW